MFVATLFVYGNVDCGGLGDDASGAAIELFVTQEEHRAMMPDYEDDERQEKSWKRKRKTGRIAVGDIIKVKGELLETWNIRKIHVMKLGTSPPHTPTPKPAGIRPLVIWCSWFNTVYRYRDRSKCRSKSVGRTTRM
jgi:hypothetical protein